MVTIAGEIYHNASSATRHLEITRIMFYRNVKPTIKAYKPKSGRRILYKQSDLDSFTGVLPVAS
jgi:hypothetical protein